MTGVLGLHHITAIASDPNRNLAFYAGILGLRFVKRTVNYDDPASYHFYFGDEVGTPGSILTFFPWPGAARGQTGVGQAAVVSFAIVPGAIGFWLERLLRHGIAYEGPVTCSPGTERVLSFRDPDGLLLELVADSRAAERPAWGGAPGIPIESAIHGFHTVALWVAEGRDSEKVLVDTLGFRLLYEEATTRRFTIGDGGPGRLVDVRTTGAFTQGSDGPGVVHHVAWAVADDPAELAVRERVRQAGLDPTPVIDRTYFHSVYFREPGGVLFELATMGPGFTVDEPVHRLGERLILPAGLEGHRAGIEAVLPPIHPPGPSTT